MASVMRDLDTITEQWWNDTDRGKLKYSEACSGGVVSTKNPTQNNLGPNPSLRGERAEANRLKERRTGSKLSRLHTFIFFLCVKVLAGATGSAGNENLLLFTS